MYLILCAGERYPGEGESDHLPQQTVDHQTERERLSEKVESKGIKSKPQLSESVIFMIHSQGNSRERSVTVSPNGEDTDTIEQNLSEVEEDDFIFVEDLKNDEEKNEMDNVSLG